MIAKKFFIFIVCLSSVFQIFLSSQEDAGIDALAADLQSSSQEKILQAANTLGEMGEKAKHALPALREALKKAKDKKTRAALGAALALIDTEPLETKPIEEKNKVVEIARLIQNDRDQLAAIKVLAEMADLYGSQVSEFHTIVEPVAKILADTNKSNEIRHEAARCLGILPMHASQNAIDAMKIYVAEQEKKWKAELASHSDVPEDVQKRIDTLQSKPTQDATALTEQMKKLSQLYREYAWLQSEGLQKIKAYETLVAKNHEQGKAFLEKAKSLIAEKRFFEAKMTACRAIGFEGYGGPVADYPRLLKKDSAEWWKTVHLINSEPDLLPIWKNCRHNAAVTSVAFSPDGKILASGSLDKTIRLCDISFKKDTLLQGHTAAVTSIAFSPDGTTLASGSLDKTIRLWNVNSGQSIKIFACNPVEDIEREHALVSVLKLGNPVILHVAFSPDGKLLASLSKESKIRLIEMASGKIIKIFYGCSHSVVFSPDGKLLASGGMNGIIKIMEVYSEKEVATFPGFGNIRFSPDGKLVAFQTLSNAIRLYDINSKEVITDLAGHSDFLSNIAFSLDGKWIISGSLDKKVKIWDVNSHKLLATHENYFAPVHSVAFSSDAIFFALADKNGNVEMWKFLPDRTESTIPVRGQSFALSRNGKTLASNSWKDILLYDIESRNYFLKLEGYIKCDVQGLAFSPDGKILASGGSKAIQIWDVNLGKRLYELEGHSGNVFALAYNNNGDILASGGDDNSVRLWDSQSYKHLKTLEGHSDYISSVAFSSDGKILASGSKDSSIRLWEIDSGKTCAILQQHRGYVNSVAFKNNSDLLASGSSDEGILIWDINSKNTFAKLPAHSKYVNSVAFNIDGNLLASAGFDGIIQIWDVKSLQNVISFQSNTKWGTQWVSFTPNGKLLVSGDLDKGIHFWELRLGFSYVEYMDFLNKKE
ncbi:MAG: PD40 domain-containing protein [Candidatus Brocadiae bacterium]|nr:PD40 domain-containing protein [Candidatus Brocadiia bacterium]